MHVNLDILLIIFLRGCHPHRSRIHHLMINLIMISLIGCESTDAGVWGAMLCAGLGWAL